MTTPDDVLAQVHDEDVHFVDLWFTDILGITKSITIPAGKLGRVIEHGAHFDGSSIDGFARVAESDMELYPDLDTFAVLPWSPPEARMARLICNAHTPQGEPFIGDPRNALIRVLREAESMGYGFKTGMEMEYFLFETQDGKPDVTAPFGSSNYFDMPQETAFGLQREIMAALQVLGIDVHSTHSEIALGQYELELAYADALQSADTVVTAQAALRTLAGKAGLACTFMPRPSEHLPGSGLHTHQSLHETESEANVFVDVNHEYGLSETARHFLAGQLHHARAMSAVLSPLVNSYKRLGKSFEAPVYVSWAHVNRAALIRVPMLPPERVSHARLELRCPDPSSNPYLAAAVMLKAGLDGIRQKMALDDPLEETLLSQKRSRMRTTEMLPVTLGEALEALRADEVVMDALGPYIGDRFLEAKQQECDEYNRHVTAWEMERYLGRY